MTPPGAFPLSLQSAKVDPARSRAAPAAPAMIPVVFLFMSFSFEVARHFGLGEVGGGERDEWWSGEKRGRYRAVTGPEAVQVMDLPASSTVPGHETAFAAS
ncbi:hypothetical protein K8P10_000563 [Leucobacter sp. Psy1]|nr:hypothetical protein K8P10_000563 [Leucobacter sp. Psy1]